jgi:hypothetical protein
MELVDFDDEEYFFTKTDYYQDQMMHDRGREEMWHGNRKRRRSDRASSSSVENLDAFELSDRIISLCDNKSKCSEIITAYGTYVKTGAYILPDSYGEVMSSKINENISSSSELRPKAVKNAKGVTHKQVSSGLWAKVQKKQNIR